MLYTIGIDVGGTNTDAVLISRRGVHKATKVPTDQKNLLDSVLKALDAMYSPKIENKLERICLSTTLTTNTIAEEKYDRVGILSFPGPGLPPKYLPFNKYLKVLSGYVDHRGRIIRNISHDDVRACIEGFLQQGIENIAVVGKFSNRNPELEKKIYFLIRDEYKEINHVSLGHKVAGSLNFPRRIATTYLNSAVYNKHKEFVTAVKKALFEKEINAPVFLLKADGGTIGLTESLQLCVNTILSGPAASIMGQITLTGEHSSAALIDIGGTTTDIALMLNGSPVFEPAGAEIAGHKTSIRALFSRSIGIGGDSAVKVEKGRIVIGPERYGPAVVMGGETPTPTDAAAYLKLIPGVDPQAARMALEPLAREMNLEVSDFARTVLEKTAEKIATTIKSICNSLSNSPVYTVKEVLQPLKIEPATVIAIGGPANILAPLVSDKLKLRPIIAPHYEVANAVGAATARPTTVATVHCDTSIGYYTVPELGIKKKIKKSSPTTEDIRILAKEFVMKRARGRIGYKGADFSKEIEITDEESFNVVRGFRTTGRIMEVKAQIKPGPLFSLHNEEEMKKNGKGS